MTKLENTFEVKKIGLKILILISFLAVVFLIGYSKYYNDRQNDLVLKTQYTFYTRIDTAGNVIAEDETLKDSLELKNESNFLSLGIGEIAKIWITEFTGQFEQKYVANAKALKNVKISKIEVLNATENIVLVEFSCEPLNEDTEYFASWGGYMAEGKMVCEWVIKFEVEDLYDNTAKIYSNKIQMAEEYGLATYNEQKKVTETTAADKTATNGLYIYQIKNSKLSVSYDGGEKWVSVPVDLGYVFAGKTSKTVLADKTYEIGLDKTVFLYGGNTESGQTVPLTVIYSNDKGVNWTSTLVSEVMNVDFSYIHFMDQKEGFIVVGYNQTAKQEKAMIFRTGDGGESWLSAGNSPTTGIIEGAIFIDDSIGYIVSKYTEGMESNIYITTDGGVNYAPFTLGPQQFEDTSTKLEWSSVYKDYQLPTVDEDGVITLIVAQSSTGDYNGGDTVAKYQSTDNGATWKYIGEE